jgi:hypothetical protein
MVNVLQGLGFRMPGIGAGEKAAFDGELRHQVVADVVVAVRRILLLAVIELQPALEFPESLVDGQHQVFLQ